MIPGVSAFVITYNQKNFIREAVEGLVLQDYDNLEVVVSDDASTDGTQEELKRLSRAYPDRLKILLNSENAGITKNFNRALAACDGEFITFIGGDDVAKPGKISAQIEWFLGNSDRVLCGHDVSHISVTGKPLGTFERCAGVGGKGPENFIRRRKMLSGTSTMVRASAIPEHGFDERIPSASDYLFWVEVLMSGAEYGSVEGVYGCRRLHGNNITITNWQEMNNELGETYAIVAQRHPEYAALCKRMITRHVVYYKGFRFLERGDKVAARKQFLMAINEDPFFIKPYIRFVQTLI